MKVFHCDENNRLIRYNTIISAIGTHMNTFGYYSEVNEIKFEDF